MKKPDTKHTYIHIKYTIIIIYTKIQIDIFNFHQNMCPQIFLKTKGVFSRNTKKAYSPLRQIGYELCLCMYSKFHDAIIPLIRLVVVNSYYI